MSYVCLWSPSWPTGADFPADLVASLLRCRAARRRRRTWTRVGRRARSARRAARRAHAARGERLRIRRRARRRGAHPVAAEVAATQSTTPLVVVKLGQDASFIAPYHACRTLAARAARGAASHGLGIETCGALRRARRRGDRGAARDRWRAALAPRPAPTTSVGYLRFRYEVVAERVVGVGGVRSQGSGAVVVRHQLAGRHGVHVARPSAASARARWRSSSRSAIARSARI